MTKRLLYLLFISSFLSLHASEWTLDTNIKTSQIEDENYRIVWPGQKILLRCKDSTGKTVPGVNWSCTKSPNHIAIKGKTANMWRPTIKGIPLKTPGLYEFTAEINGESQSLSIYIQDILNFTVNGNDVVKTKYIVALNEDKDVLVQVTKALVDIPLPPSKLEWKVNRKKVGSKGNQSCRVPLKLYNAKEVRVDLTIKGRRMPLTVTLLPISLYIKPRSSSKGAKLTLDIIGPRCGLSLRRAESIVWDGAVFNKKESSATENERDVYLIFKKSERQYETNKTIDFRRKAYFEGHRCKEYRGDASVSESNKNTISAKVTFPDIDGFIYAEVKSFIIEDKTITYDE